MFHSQFSIDDIDALRQRAPHLLGAYPNALQRVDDSRLTADGSGHYSIFLLSREYHLIEVSVGACDSDTDDVLPLGQLSRKGCLHSGVGIPAVAGCLRTGKLARCRAR